MHKIGGTFTDGCKGLLGYLFGHKFESRYDEKDTTSDEVVKQAKSAIDALYSNDCFANSYDASRILENFQNMNSIETIYVHDICVRCGKVITR